MEAGESKRSSSPISPITIRAPGWFRTLYVGSFVAWVVLASILLFVGHSELTSVISLMFWVSAAATLPVAVACSIQRLEYVGNNVVLVRLFRRIGFGTRVFATQEVPAQPAVPNLVSGVGKLAFIGGMRTPGFNATWPFAGLSFADEGFTLRLMGVVLVRGDWAYVESAQRVVGGLLGSPGVRLVLADGQRFVFWSFQPDAVLAALRVLGVQIVDPNGRPPKVWLST